MLAAVLAVEERLGGRWGGSSGSESGDLAGPRQGARFSPAGKRDPAQSGAWGPVLVQVGW